MHQQRRQQAHDARGRCTSCCCFMCVWRGRGRWRWRCVTASIESHGRAPVGASAVAFETHPCCARPCALCGVCVYVCAFVRGVCAHVCVCYVCAWAGVGKRVLSQESLLTMSSRECLQESLLTRESSHHVIKRVLSPCHQERVLSPCHQDWRLLLYDGSDVCVRRV